MSGTNSKLVKGIYVSGSNHSVKRPKFYEHLGLRQGTINILLSMESYQSILLPTKRVAGIDAFDLEENQDFLIRPCVLKGVSGFQILPINRTTDAPQGLHAVNILEISLIRHVEIKHDDVLEVELQDYE